MSALAHIGREIEKQVITAVVAAGLGRTLLERFCEAPGVLSISHHHARGVGARRLRTDQMYFKEWDVMIMLVESAYADEVFREVYAAGMIGHPEGGIIFAETVLRGHPMMPFEGADW